jgi:NADPH-dependent F420 reductase
LGGTGKEGSGLALRWARHEEVTLGSRKEEKAARVSAELNERLGADLIRGASNREAAGAAVLTVPYGAHRATLDEVRDALAGKVLIDVTVPVDPERPAHLRDAALSAAEEAQEFLGPAVHVAAAFQTIAFTLLHDLAASAEGDVLVCSDHADARDAALHLARRCGFRALEVGPLRHARVVEGMTPLLIHLNRRYKVKHAGFGVSGLEGEDQGEGRQI